jgi:dTMP kinase
MNKYGYTMQLTKGFLLVIEGIDGSGKTSLAQLLASSFIEKNIDTVLTKAPGATALGSQIRSMIQEQTIKINPIAQCLLFAADRAQHFDEIIIPALEQKKLIISDRMSDSSLAYQGYGNQLDILMIRALNEWTMHQKEPDLVIYLDVTIKTALHRISKRGSLSLFEKEDFLCRVKKGFEEILKQRTNVIIIDSADPLDMVHTTAFEKVQKWLMTNHYFPQ